MAVVNLFLTFDSFVGATDGVRVEHLLLLLEQSLGFGHGKKGREERRGDMVELCDDDTAAC